MADIATISTAIAGALTAALCPEGRSASSCTGRPVIIRRGGLTQADLGNALHTLHEGCDFITIADTPESWSRLDEPLGRPWRMENTQAATVSISIANGTVTLGLAPDTVPSGTVGLRVQGLAGITGAGCCLHRAQSGDTAASIAARLAAMVPGAVAQEGNITLPTSVTAQAINAGTATARCVARRQQQMFVLTAWSASPVARDALGQAMADALALTDWLVDANSSTFRIEAREASNDDTAMNRGIFARPAHYLVTFDTDLTRSMPLMLAGGIGGADGLIAGDVLLGAPAAS
ncbi:hypothetical protein ACM0P6_02110 [Komagataeibacter sucrofermentans]|uniref:Uncharacterized protein n=1 Tax=Komagataeibacter sucrofermentans TaxID=1053551 RepID=A0A318QE25_9PROT|nr:hypothetical protein [Komagataeibacter sucrofermentans]PYD77837.1 hypothetical protein CFR77_13735 [Komagataeibacter sucrofermentans]GBQ46071.1 hypothetical protein AA15973_0796 [Komagataeibacter sucrofermentans DSM 15973]